MSFESIEEECFGWNANCSDQLESISIQSQDQVYQQYLFVDKPDCFGQLDSYQQLSEVIESNSMFDESLLFPSVQSKSKDGTKENVSSKDSVNNNFCEDNIDMNKIVGELINKKATDKTNGHCRGVSKSSINNCDCNYQNDASCCSSCKGSQDLKEKEANIKQSKQAKDQSKRNSLLYTKISRISTPMVPKRTCRWGKAEDKIMYKQLCITCQQKGINVNALSLQFSLTNEQHYEALLNLKREMRWVGTTKQLLQRILKICEVKVSSKLSVRDQRLARKLAIKQVEEQAVDINVIMYHFPGKNPEEVKSVCNKIFQKQAFINQKLSKVKGE